MGRGKSRRSIGLIDASIRILSAIQPCSVRAVCYQLFNQHLIPAMSKAETSRVSRLLTDAREAGTISWDWIVDDTREPVHVNAWNDVPGYLKTIRRAYRKNRWADQPTILEVWSEKSTVSGTLQPVLDDYGVSFRVMHGYGSATALHDAAVDSAAAGLTVLYCGDFDPSGMHMSEVDLPVRLARYGGDVTIVRVALTASHCAGLGTGPRFSVESKQTDARYRWFRQTCGAWCWELDALSPVILRDAVAQAIRARLDLGAWEASAVVETAERESIASILATWPGISGPVTKYLPEAEQ